MLSNNLISRRRFLKRSAVGIGTAGIGLSQSSKLFSAVKVSGSPAFPIEKVSPREICVVSITKEGIDENTSEKFVKKMFGRLEMVSSYRPDIICLPEVFATTAKKAETVPGPIVNKFAYFAKTQKCYIICPLHTRRNDKIYNSAVLIDRKGNIVGQYDKIHLTEGECDQKITPGNAPPPVFKTDFGVIGIQICFDINWVEEWKSLKEQGAEIVFWPSAYPGGRMLSGLAWLFQYYVVGCSWRDPALIFDMSGDLISESGKYDPWAFSTLNLEKIHCEIAYHVGKVKKIRKKYGRRVHIRYYHNEDWVTIESRSPDLTINQIIEGFDLTTHWDYIKRAEKYQNRFRQR